jgi:hypothetical protein
MTNEECSAAPPALDGLPMDPALPGWADFWCRPSGPGLQTPLSHVHSCLNLPQASQVLPRHAGAKRDDKGEGGVSSKNLMLVKRTAGPSLRYAAVGACDFLILACSSWLESSEEHVLTSIAGVLRLRAISRSLCDRSARRFAQDDGFVGD